jgi:hypothetical protein
MKNEEEHLREIEIPENQKTTIKAIKEYFNKNNIGCKVTVFEQLTKHFRPCLRCNGKYDLFDSTTVFNIEKNYHQKVCDECLKTILAGKDLNYILEEGL